jgi:cupin 2 domain-containing protein
MSNLFQHLPPDLTSEVFESLATSKTVNIERIVSLGHQTPANEWYDQPQCEWVIVLQGEAVLVFEQGESIRLSPGDYVNIQPHQKHRVAWTDPHQPTIWLAVHYSV